METKISLRKRFLELRLGHSNYLIYAISISNFLIISYTLLLERWGFAKTLFPSIGIYAVVFLLVYPVVSISLGYWHRTKQYPVEMASSALLDNPLQKRIWITVLKNQLVSLHSIDEGQEIRELLKILENER